MVGGRGGVVGEGGRRVAARDLGPVDPRDEPVVVLHLEPQRADVVGRRHTERRPHVGGGRDVEHLRPHVRAKQTAVVGRARAQRVRDSPAFHRVAQQRKVGGVDGRLRPAGDGQFDGVPTEILIEVELERGGQSPSGHGERAKGVRGAARATEDKRVGDDGAGDAAVVFIGPAGVRDARDLEPEPVVAVNVDRPRAGGNGDVGVGADRVLIGVGRPVGKQIVRAEDAAGAHVHDRLDDGGVALDGPQAASRAVGAVEDRSGDGDVAQVAARGDINHPRAKTRRQRRRRLVLVTHPGGAGNPAGVVEGRLLPRRAEAVVGGNERARRRPRADERRRRLVHRHAVGDVRHLLRVGRRKIGHDARGVGRDEAEVLAGRIEAEIRVQRQTRDGAVLTGGEDGEKSAGTDRHVGERPLVQNGGIVGEVIAGEIDVGGGGVVQLDPVGTVSVLVLEAGVVDGEKFADERRGRGRGDADAHQAAALQRFERGACEWPLDRAMASPAATEVARPPYRARTGSALGLRTTRSTAQVRVHA